MHVGIPLQRQTFTGQFWQIGHRLDISLDLAMPFTQRHVLKRSIIAVRGETRILHRRVSCFTSPFTRQLTHFSITEQTLMKYLRR
jgi:hypothetical protein